ncbi:MAG: porin [Armatimonadota bacterium]
MRAIIALLILGTLMGTPFVAAQQPANVPAALSGGDSSQLSYTDVFMGRNTRGPYLLSWKGIRVRSERVVVDGRTFRRDEEYTIDYTAGTLVFTQPLRNGSMAQVSYEIDAKTAQRNPKTLQMPLDMELLNAARGKLALTGAYSAPLDKPGKETTLLGLTGELLPSGSTQVSATFLTDVNARGRLEEKSGLRLQATSKGDLAEWTLSYLTAGREFSGAQTWKVKPDTDALSTSLKLLLSQRLNLSLGFQQSDTGGARVAGTSASLAYNLSEGVRAVVSYLNQENPLATATTTSAAVNLQRGALTAGVERHTQQQQSLLQGRSEVTTNRLTAQVSLTPGTQAQALLEQQRLEGVQGASERSTASLGVTTSPVQGVQLRTGIRYDEIGEKQQTELSLGLEAKPSSAYRLLGSYVQRQGELGDRTTAASLRMVSAPRPMVQLETGASLETTGERASLKQDVLLALQPWQGIRLETGVQGMYAGDHEGYIRTLRAQLAPNRTWRMDATHRLRLTDSGALPETWGVALSVTPSQSLSLTGSYTRNPEDNKGNIKQQEQAELKLQARMSALTLQGSMGVKRDLLSNTNITLADVALVYRFSPLMELLTGYRLNRQQTTSELTAHTYRLGYRYALSDLFNISLEGTLTTYERDHIFQPNQTEYEARLKLGVRF